jgi:pantetheine-phosphate adenylyltransferase
MFSVLQSGDSMTLIFPGSFDPVTDGHMDIIRRAAKLAQHLIVAVLDNPKKQNLFSAEERISILKEAVAEAADASSSQSIEITAFSGLLADFAVQKNATAIIRGLRSPEDFAQEHKYAAANTAISEALNKQIETIFLPSVPSLSQISGTVIREAAVHIYKNGLNDSFIAENVPTAARLALEFKFSQEVTTHGRAT